MPVEEMRTKKSHTGAMLSLALAEHQQTFTTNEAHDQALRHRVAMERLVATISTTFISLASNEIDDGINRTLQTIGEFVGVDRSHIFLFSDDKTTISNTHEWCAAGLESARDKLQELPVDLFSWSMGKLNRFEHIYVPCLDDLPPEANPEKERLQTLAIRSFVMVPMVYGQALIGCLGFASHRVELSWAAEDITLLRMVAEIMVNGLVRKRAEYEIQQRNRELTVLNTIAATLSRSLDIDQMLNDVLDEILQLDILGIKSKAMIFLLNEETGKLHLVAQRGQYKEAGCANKPLSVRDCLCGLAAATGEPVISQDCWQDERHTFRRPNMPSHKDICQPLKVHGKVLGVLNVCLPPEQEVAIPQLKRLTAIGDQISLAIENARLFVAFKQQSDRLRALAARLSEIEEDQRKRLARELHDQIGQKLTALGLNLNIIQTQLSTETTEKLNSCLNDSLLLVEETTERIRDVMAFLRPPVLDDYGLMAALQWYGSRFSSWTDVEFTIQGENPQPRLPAPVENALFRITQEALTNVAKHAHATQVTLTLDQAPVRLIIADNGVGFDPDQQAAPDDLDGWGLLTIVERAEAIGAQCRIESRPGHGTRIIVEVIE